MSLLEERVNKQQEKILELVSALPRLDLVEQTITVIIESLSAIGIEIQIPNVVGAKSSSLGSLKNRKLIKNDDVGLSKNAFKKISPEVISDASRTSNIKPRKSNEPTVRARVATPKGSGRQTPTPPEGRKGDASPVPERNKVKPAEDIANKPKEDFKLVIKSNDDGSEETTPDTDRCKDEDRFRNSSVDSESLKDEGSARDEHENSVKALPKSIPSSPAANTAANQNVQNQDKRQDTPTRNSDGSRQKVLKSRISLDLKKQNQTIRSPNVRTYTQALSPKSTSENLPDDQIQFFRSLLKQIEKDNDKLKSLLEFGRTMGTVEHTLIVSWQTLSSYRYMLINKPIEKLASNIHSMWSAIKQVIVLPAEIQKTIQGKIDLESFDQRLFDDALQYMESVILLIILPSYVEKMGIPVPESTKKHRMIDNNKKDWSLKIIAAKNMAKKKEKKKVIPAPRRDDLPTVVNTAGMAKKETINTVNTGDASFKPKPKSEQAKKVDQQIQITRDRIVHLKSKLTEFDSFLNSAQNWVRNQADEEQLKICEKIVPESNNSVFRMNAKIEARIDKIRSSFPMQQKEPPRDINKLKMLERQSSIVADKIWEELRPSMEESSTRSKYMLSPRSSTTWVSPPMSPSRHRPGQHKNLVKIPSIKNLRKDSHAADNSQAIEGDIQDFLDEIEREKPIPEESSASEGTPHYEHIDPYVNNEKILEDMDDISFEELLRGLVASPHEEDSASALEFLKSKLSDLENQYGDLLDEDE
eukprot:TRINITY_DN5625_c0_g1_i1.p1 TRINITY_DN5625_c0_g1~~TRINITY_DN5625_c0_g1_i1.p1  ORF type:complete len:756 (-),score=189.52 TRINITY_DN5625_c0_g1_i1:889-3156(-)